MFPQISLLADLTVQWDSEVYVFRESVRSNAATKLVTSADFEIDVTVFGSPAQVASSNILSHPSVISSVDARIQVVDFNGSRYSVAVVSSKY